jgi:hypothetical protein
MTIFIARDSHQGIGGVVFVSICSLAWGVYNDQRLRNRLTSALFTQRDKVDKYNIISLTMVHQNWFR